MSSVGGIGMNLTLRERCPLPPIESRNEAVGKAAGPWHREDDGLVVGTGKSCHDLEWISRCGRMQDPGKMTESQSARILVTPTCFVRETYATETASAGDRIWKLMDAQNDGTTIPKDPFGHAKLSGPAPTK